MVANTKYHQTDILHPVGSVYKVGHSGTLTKIFRWPSTPNHASLFQANLPSPLMLRVSLSLPLSFRLSYTVSDAQS